MRKWCESAGRTCEGRRKSRLAGLEAEIDEYDALRHGRTRALEAHSIPGIGEAPIKARIMGNLAQMELAGRPSLAGQQLQRHEATRYRGVAAGRLQEVADALKLKLREVCTLEKV